MGVDQCHLLIHDTTTQPPEASASKQKLKQDGNCTQMFPSGREAETAQRAHADCKSVQQVAAG